jgi:hypothetical protein
MTNTEPNSIIVWGILFSNLDLISQIENELQIDFGKIILRSEIIPFDFTGYYEKEMGKNLKRLWIVTEQLIKLDHLADIKNFARKMEVKFQDENKNRKINIDPGALTLSNFVLATTKNYGHRIYLKDEIFAEVTLIYRKKSFQALEWTYPDYRNAIEFFNQVRVQFNNLLTNGK